MRIVNRSSRLTFQFNSFGTETPVLTSPNAPKVAMALQFEFRFVAKRLMHWQGPRQDIGRCQFLPTRRVL